MYPWDIDPAGRRRKMKKYALVALFAVVSLGMVFAATAVPPTEGNISITGEVKEAFSLKVPGTYSGTIENGSSEETWKIGDIVVASNVDGWIIHLESSNYGYLVHDPENQIAYTVTLGELAKGVTLGKDGWTSDSQHRTSKGGNAYPLSVSFGPSSEYYVAGSYSDLITVTIKHN